MHLLFYKNVFFFCAFHFCTRELQINCQTYNLSFIELAKRYMLIKTLNRATKLDFHSLKNSL